MRKIAVALMVDGAGWIAAAASAHEEHGQAGEQVLTGEVVDVVCYLGHGAQGRGKAHADCGSKCIKSGLPVALKVGDQLYLAANADHTAANARLAEFAGEQVTVRGSVTERDGQHLIEIASVEKASGSPDTASKTYTCPMHPEVKASKPGPCPKCGMALEAS